MAFDKSTFDRGSLRGVHLVPLTAFDERGKINFSVQEKHIARLSQAGVRVYMPAAGTGEFHSLSADEIVDVVKLTREVAGPDATIFAPVGIQAQHAIDIGKRSLAAGADGVMFMPLLHPYLCDPGAKDYYLQVLEPLRCPALVYKRGAVPSDKLLLELADTPYVVGIKYAENQMHEFRKTLMADRGRIEWLCGTAERFAPYYMLAGATGFTSGAGNLCPHLALALHAALAGGHYDEAMRYQQLILPVEDYRERAGESYNISLLKAAMQLLLGEDFGPARSPQRAITPTEHAEIVRLLTPVMEAERELSKEAETVGLGGKK